MLLIKYFSKRNICIIDAFKDGINDFLDNSRSHREAVSASRGLDTAIRALTRDADDIISTTDIKETFKQAKTQHKDYSHVLDTTQRLTTIFNSIKNLQRLKASFRSDVIESLSMETVLGKLEVFESANIDFRDFIHDGVDLTLNNFVYNFRLGTGGDLRSNAGFMITTSLLRYCCDFKIQLLDEEPEDDEEQSKRSEELFNTIMNTLPSYDLFSGKTEQDPVLVT